MGVTKEYIAQEIYYPGCTMISLVNGLYSSWGNSHYKARRNRLLPSRMGRGLIWDILPYIIIPLLCTCAEIYLLHNCSCLMYLIWDTLPYIFYPFYVHMLSNVLQTWGRGLSWDSLHCWTEWSSCDHLRETQRTSDNWQSPLSVISRSVTERAKLRQGLFLNSLISSRM